jgi:hypothetical protein
VCFWARCIRVCDFVFVSRGREEFDEEESNFEEEFGLYSRV